jgi:multiple sugar transport system substrate-binding protein
MKKIPAESVIRLLCITLFLLFPGCSQKKSESGGKITITFWHSCVSSTVPALNELLDRYQKEHPGIEIKAQYVPSGDALIQKLITAVQSNNAPDISWIHADFLQDLVRADAIFKIDDLMVGPDTLVRNDLSDIFPALLLQAKWRGTLYTLPMEATGVGLLCNRELFRKAGLDPDQPPRTWEELKVFSEKLTIDRNGDGKFDQMGFFVPVFPSSGPLSGWMVWQWYPFLFQAGGNVINVDQTQVLYNSDAGVQALTLWRDIYSALNLSSFTIDYEVAFASKTLAMTLDGPWNIPRWQQIKGLDWMVAPLPAGPTKRATVAGGEYLALFKQTKNRREAWEFMKWILRPETQAMWSMKSGYLPVRRAVHGIPEYQKFLDENPALKAYVDQLEVGQAPNPVDYEGLKITRHIAEAIEQATLGKKDPKTVLDEAAAKSNGLLRAVVRN